MDKQKQAGELGYDVLCHNVKSFHLINLQGHLHITSLFKRDFLTVVQ